MYTGPPLTENIFDVLLRFRANQVALTGDIEKAFLMVGMTEEDRDALRFLWVDDIEKSSPEIVVLRFTRVVFGVSSSPFVLNATIKHHIERYKDADPEFVERFLRSIYADDLSSGAPEINAAYELYLKSFSNWQRLLRVTALILKFVRIMKLLLKRDAQSRDESTTQLIAVAETLWIKEVQKSLSKNPKFETWRKQFGIFTDHQGITRCTGRLAEAELSTSRRSA